MLPPDLESLIEATFEPVYNQVSPEDVRYAIVGSRKYPSELIGWIYGTVELIHEIAPTAIFVSGRSPGGGPDCWGEWRAQQLGVKREIYPMDRETHGQKAPWIRNKQIAMACDVMYAFQAGDAERETSGTKHVVGQAQKLLRPVVVIRPGDYS